jgi:hypothetical protein
MYGVAMLRCLFAQEMHSSRRRLADFQVSELQHDRMPSGTIRPVYNHRPSTMIVQVVAGPWPWPVGGSSVHRTLHPDGHHMRWAEARALQLLPPLHQAVP